MPVRLEYVFALIYSERFSTANGAQWNNHLIDTLLQGHKDNKNTPTHSLYG